MINPLQSYALRELCRQRFFVVDMSSNFKRKIIALLDQTFPEYEKLFSDTFGKSSMELLANYTTPEEILSVDSQTAKNSFGIVLAANVAAFKAPAVSFFYQKKRSEGKIFAVLRDNKPYVPDSVS